MKFTHKQLFGKIYFIIVLLSFIQYFSAQDKAEKALQKFEQDYPQEKIHLLFNKDQYVAGENLWFKCFVFEGYNRSTISTSLFVELYDISKKLIDKKMVPLIKGEGNGSFLLPTNLKEDAYFIRAYTTWMTNFSENFNYLQPITVYNPESPQKLKTDTEAVWSATVYPESGTFIDGIKTKFAVRLHSKGITPSEWSGFVSDAESPDVPIVKFTGFDQNVGSFSLNPKAGKNYRLTVEDTTGKKVLLNLPPVATSGLNLQVESTNNEVKYSIHSKNISDNKPYKVLATINSQLVYKAEFKKLSDKTFIIPVENLTNGVLQLTVFDSEENVAAQRLCFVQADQVNIKIPELKSNLNTEKRAKNSFTIPKNEHYTDYSIMVLDYNAKSSEEENSIFSSLWLTGDLGANIFKPAQYFTKNRNSQALDALLISEKWKRFNFKDLISDRYPKITNLSDAYISYKAKVMLDNGPAVNKALNLIFDSSEVGSKFYQVQTDSSGNFTLSGLQFEGNMNVSYQIEKDTKSSNNNFNVYFQPNNNFIAYKNNLPDKKYKLVQKTAEDQKTDVAIKAINNIKFQTAFDEKVTEIEEVKIKGVLQSKTKKLEKELVSSLFQSIDEKVFDFVNDNENAYNAPSILLWLQGRVAGLEVYSTGIGINANLRGNPINLYLNEMPARYEQLQAIPVSSIAMVKVFPGAMGIIKNAIAVYTRRGNMPHKHNSEVSYLKKYTLKGYDIETKFINLLYDESKFKKLDNDNRETLYWNPKYTIESNDNQPIEFYNNDHAKSFKVIIIGFDEETDTPFYYNDILK
ncbi:hypothetical protein K0U91_13040 [Chryseobacterium chendengshani]|uniref:hypothetical protein n=1 Tax=Chryseobacterium sp. LJ668 TaxID=2864040 RepID=UPI001C693DFA|nr:hypothetical protein [Chryseobacterium sp. LJ668]MBW8523694.1 hypothetical protein [Chryseobacterium sp. LJ668]QYK15974.1 hypothetical protein K0U91_13040 [Chryseobacterium sp. LJ668]